MKFIITVDTEADNQWKGGELALANILAIPRFQEICNHYHFPPTYLLTYEVASSATAIGVLKPYADKGVAEIGTHLHPWTTPPFFDQAQEEKHMHFPSELDDEFLKKKLITLHEVIVQNFGIPTSFRAGRWGYDDRIGKLMGELGYIVDCSITPFVNWQRTIKGGRVRRIPNFTSVSFAPSLLAPGLIEIPMTILPKDTAWISRFGARLLQRGSFRVRWCRIFPETTLADLIAVYMAAKKQKLPYMEFMVHSSEFIVGGSPYSKTEEQVAHFFQTFEQFLCFLQKENVEGILLSDAAKKILGEVSVPR